MPDLKYRLRIVETVVLARETIGAIEVGVNPALKRATMMVRSSVEVSLPRCPIVFLLNGANSKLL